MRLSNRRMGVISITELNTNIILGIYFILALEYDLYNFFNLGALISGFTLTLLEILLMIFVIFTTKRKVKKHYVMYVFLLSGIIGTYILTPECIEFLQEFFFEGSSFKKVFLLPLAVHCIIEPRKFVDKLYKLLVIEGYIHVICNAIWGYGFDEWGTFNYMTYGMVLVTPTCFVMQRAFAKPSRLNIFTLILFEINVIVYGHRGALLVTMVMMAIFFIKYVNIQKKLFVGIGGIFVFLLFFTFQEQIVQFLFYLMERMGLESRTLTKLLSGDITDDSERKMIWALMAAAIFNSFPFGRGIGADRLLLGRAMRDGLYAHNFILELCLDYGLVLGSIIVFWIIRMVYNSLRNIESEEWSELIVPFLVPSVLSLLTSASIYKYWLFWLSVGLYYCYFGRGGKRRSRTIILKKENGDIK